MTVVITVRGPISASELGITYPHEHLLTTPPVTVTDPDLTLDSEDAAVRELGLFYAAGGRALVEMSPRDYGRAPAGLRRLAERSGVHIIATTGWHKDRFCRPWVAERSINDLADEMIRDIEEGIDGTGVRAGVIKAASSLNTITPAEEKVFRAAARAQRATGVPISTHTEAGTMGLEQVALLRSEGVDPGRLMIGHVDRNMDPTYQRALLQTGVTISYDQLSKEKYHPDRLRVEFLLHLVQDGWGKQFVLSGDFARKSYWPSYGGWGGPGLTYILWRFVPWLREQGLDPTVIDDILVATPARLFQIAR
ncbi:MAG: phosphotriesterase-related protein [Herpetosiphonaceae bacterium]|nr:phosphotriesterase-related protein [Herpetosiphonaceae bacterium]